MLILCSTITSEHLLSTNWSTHKCVFVLPSMNKLILHNLQHLQLLPFSCKVILHKNVFFLSFSVRHLRGLDQSVLWRGCALYPQLPRNSSRKALVRQTRLSEPATPHHPSAQSAVGPPLLLGHPTWPRDPPQGSHLLLGVVSRWGQVPSLPGVPQRPRVWRTICLTCPRGLQPLVGIKPPTSFEWLSNRNGTHYKTEDHVETWLLKSQLYEVSWAFLGGIKLGRQFLWLAWESAFF